eukprot:233445-Hanusia_phi.AAC.1
MIRSAGSESAVSDRTGPVTVAVSHGTVPGTTVTLPSAARRGAGGRRPRGYRRARSDSSGQPRCDPGRSGIRAAWRPSDRRHRVLSMP